MVVVDGVVLNELRFRRLEITFRGDRFMGLAGLAAFDRGLGLVVRDGGRGRCPMVYVQGRPSAVAPSRATRVIAVCGHTRPQERLVQCGRGRW